MKVAHDEISSAINLGKEQLVMYKQYIEQLANEGDREAEEEFRKAYSTVFKSVEILQNSLKNPDLKNSTPYKTKPFTSDDMNENI